MIVPAPGAARAPANWLWRQRNPALKTAARTTRKNQVSNTGLVLPARESRRRTGFGRIPAETDNESQLRMEVLMMEL
jgi:hypothetical protein